MDTGKSMFSSPPFQFIVNGEPLYGHAELVSRYSEPIDRLMNINMKEKSQGYAEMTGVETATFDRFLEWMYRGKYSSPTPKDDTSPGDMAPGEDKSDLLDIFGGAAGGSKKKKKTSTWNQATANPFGAPAHFTSTSESRDRLQQEFAERSYIERPTALPDIRNESGSYKDVFLCHAQLYRFADEKDIQTLKYLALENLHGCLKHFILNEKRTGDIIALLRYVYQNTFPAENSEAEPLRALLKDYIGFEMDTLMKDEDFNALIIDDGGPLLGDFMEMIIRRI